MEIGKLPMAIVGITIAVIVCAVILIPVVQDATATNDTFVNKGYFYVDSIEDGDSWNYHFEDGVLTINGVQAPTPSDNTYPDGLTIFFTEHITARFNTSGKIVIKGQTNSTCEGIDLTISNGTITGTYTHGGTVTNANNWQYTKFVGMSTSVEDRVMSQPVPQYLHKDSLIDTTGFTYSSKLSSYYVVSVTGSIDDGITINMFSQGDGSPILQTTVSNIQMDYTQSNTHDDLYILNKITFDLTKDGVTDTATYTIYTVPASVTADRLVQIDSTTAQLINVIPLLVIIGIVMLAVGAMIYYRR